MHFIPSICSRFFASCILSVTFINALYLFCKMVDEQVYELQKFLVSIQAIDCTGYCWRNTVLTKLIRTHLRRVRSFQAWSHTTVLYTRETKAPQITAEDRLKRNKWWFNFYNLFFPSETCLGMLGLHENPL